MEPVGELLSPNCVHNATPSATTTTITARVQRVAVLMCG
jgi:hypothetical protein